MSLIEIWLRQKCGSSSWQCHFTKCPPLKEGRVEWGEPSNSGPRHWPSCIASVFTLHSWQEGSDHSNLVPQKTQAPKQGRNNHSQGIAMRIQVRTEESYPKKKQFLWWSLFIIDVNQCTIIDHGGLCLKQSHIRHHFVLVFVDFAYHHWHSSILFYDKDSVKQEQLQLLQSRYFPISVS